VNLKKKLKMIEYICHAALVPLNALVSLNDKLTRNERGKCEQTVILYKLPLGTQRETL